MHRDRGTEIAADAAADASADAAPARVLLLIGS
jgi:hypothetical protein